MRFIIRLLISAVALGVTFWLVDLCWDGQVLPLIIIALLFGLVNALIRPLLIILTCPLIVLTLGLGIFVINVLMLWLLMLTASVVWRILGETLQLEARGRRWRTLFVLSFVILPWALLPRILNPPQPPVAGEDLRLANNALRAAEFTYGITGLWVQRLAVEDVRRDAANAQDALETGSTANNQVCLRGYTWFFIPWQRYRIGLDPNGASPLSLVPVPLTGSCW